MAAVCKVLGGSLCGGEEGTGGVVISGVLRVVMSFIPHAKYIHLYRLTHPRFSA